MQKKSLILTSLTLTFAGICDTITLAQIAPDSTLGAESSTVTPIDAQIDRIDGGAMRGANLFHSFREFNIGVGRAVYFSNPSQIQNILTRITGSTPSNIFGTLGVSGNANLFLINPNGIIFGSDAQLDLRGSFIASAASSVKFAGGAEFSATNPQSPPLLTVSVPVGLQFGKNPGNIRVLGPGLSLPEGDDLLIPENDKRFQQNFLESPAGLRVGEGRTLALTGGDILLEGGFLKAPAGRIELGSVRGEGLVSLTPTDKGFALGYEGVRSFGEIQLADTAGVSTGGEGGGDIQVLAGRLTIKDGSEIIADTLGSKPGGTLAVTASESVEIVSTSPDEKFPSALRAQTFGTGNAGSVTIQTGRLTVRNGGLIGAATNSLGHGGTVTVEASESVEVFGISAKRQAPSLLGAATYGIGNAGSVTIQTGWLSLRDGAGVGAATNNSGNAGTVTVKARESVEVLDNSILAAFTAATGNAGSVTIQTGRLSVRDGGKVTAATFSSGNGGTVEIRASESVEVSGTTPNRESPSLLGATTYGAGNAGSVKIQTGRLSVRDGGNVSVTGLASGTPGNLQVTARDIHLDSKGTLSAASETGIGGNITLQAQSIQLRRNSEISAAGSKTGNITLEGNITINADTLVLLEGSRLVTSASDPGGGSNIKIAPLRGSDIAVFKSPDSTINAVGQLRVEGDVQLTPAEVPAVEFTDVTSLINRRCSELEGSRFTVTGKGGLPPDPTGLLNGSTTVIDWGAEQEFQSHQVEPEFIRSTPQVETGFIASRTQGKIPKSPNPGSPLVEAQGWAINSSGEVILTAEPPTGTPHAPVFAPPGCN
ncbi:MAG: filamentous hemagglutinin N-terminal domain-containing protein [Oscillatoria sp. Prado101]|jgi:filamentous hemagglutinin family protein|nr:filamentous hemagglutinin N-terminal domain-containing protein [Oscillatoria sp. Prado101]